MSLRIKNWTKFQHFKDRRPPWIKLYRDLLDDINYFSLADKTGKYLPLLWLIASEKDGVLPDSHELAFRLRLSDNSTNEILDELLSRAFLTESEDDDAPAISNAKSIAARNGFGSRHISDVTKRSVWERDGGKCQFCEATKDIEYDHIHPVSKGGNSEIENIQLLCRPCNRKKRAKTAEQDATPAQPLRSLETETETEKEGEGEKKRVRAATPFLEGVSESLLADYLQVRKAKKAGPLTDTAVAGLQREAGKANLTLCQAVTACVEFGWQGFNAGWYADRTKGKTQPGAVLATASHDPDSRSAIEAEGVAKGIGPWNEINEQWHVYKARVRGKPMNNLGLDALAAMAAQRSQAGAH